MSSIVTKEGILHYETIGRGKPVILLHGWINSWDVWRDCMFALNRVGRYRVYALDFWGFGDSAKSNVDTFRLKSYVGMVYQFMETLGIQASPIFGHSMGGTVALKFALTHPERIQKVAIVGSPIVGRSLNPFLKLAGQSWIAEIVWRYPIILHTIMRILLANDSAQVRQMIFRDVQRTNMEPFFRSIDDLRRTDLRKDLANLHIPALGIYGTRDRIVSPKNAKLLLDGSELAQVVMMDKSGHFPMTDQPEKFMEVLDAFLSNNDNSKKSPHGRVGTGS
ncbi:MAG TPA: alpha/beta hydrolase [Anaerolineae bacterium]|nr:alpha/beta hydrolase [Anaerolineae bacterium]